MGNDQGQNKPQDQQQPAQPTPVEKKPEVANIPQDSTVIPAEAELKKAV